VPARCCWRPIRWASPFRSGSRRCFLNVSCGSRKSSARHLGTIEKVTGALLVLTGILFLTGGMATMAYWLLETFPALGRIG
jgi:hypothetical protein